MIRLALVGCGGISRAHRARFETLAHRMQVVACVDLDLARAQEAAAALDAALATTDLDAALAVCDAVLVATPHHEHHPIGMRALEAGKHVLMEKPLAISEQECLELIATAQARSLTLMVAYCMRFHPLTLAFAEAIHQETFGPCFHVSIWTEQYTRFPGEDPWAHRAATLGGGQFFSHGCHYVDILLHLLGQPVRGMHLGTNFGTPWMEREGTSDAVIQFASGAVGYHGGTWGARGTRLGYAFHAQCQEGCLEADFHAGTLKLLRTGEPERLLLESESSSKYMDREMAHFLDCIATGQTPITNAPDSLQGLRVIWRLYDAEARGVVADLQGLGLARR